MTLPTDVANKALDKALDGDSTAMLALAVDGLTKGLDRLGDTLEDMVEDMGDAVKGSGDTFAAHIHDAISELAYNISKTLRSAK